MGFYSALATYYEQIFPLREVTWRFLRRHLPATGALLDVGCGTGHSCGRLAEQGHAVVGIDPDGEMIAAGRERYPAVRFAELSMQEVAAVEGAFAGAYCIGNVAAHLGADDWPGFLADLRGRLSPGAPWIVQTVNFDPILQLPRFRFPDIVLAGGAAVFERRYEDITADRLRFVTRLREGDRILAAGEVKLFPATAAEYVQRHAAGGFEPVHHAADFNGKPFDATHHSGSVFVFRARR